MTTLKSLVDETTNIKNELVECENTLRQILINKNIDGLEEKNKLPILINIVNELQMPKIKWLYNNGNEYVATTGGFYKYGEGTFENNGTCLITTAFKPSLATTCHLLTKKLIDLTFYSKLYVEYECNVTNTNDASHATHSVGFTDKVGSALPPVLNYSGPTDRRTVTLDISSFNTSVYFLFRNTLTLHVTGDKQVCKIYKIWLEV